MVYRGLGPWLYKIRVQIPFKGGKMLVLSRKTNESVIIGDDVEVLVLEIREGTVKLGIKAPLSISVHRQEVYQEIIAENKRALSLKQSNLEIASLAFKDSLPKKVMKRRKQDRENVSSENIRALSSREVLSRAPGIFHFLPKKNKNEVDPT